MRALALLLLLAVACNLPTEDDVREATAEAAERATEVCKAVLREETPRIVSTVTSAALLACVSLAQEIDDARTVVEESRPLIVYEVLANLGCNWDGTTWDCSTTVWCVQ